MKDIKGVSFFSGCGGSTLGYTQAGLNVIGCCEINKKQLDIYLANHKVDYIYNNIVDVLDNDYNELYNLDFFDGSPPCVNFSKLNVNKKKNQFKLRKYCGFSIEIEDLVLKYFKVVTKYKPKFFVFENVLNINYEYKDLLEKYITESNINKDYDILKIILDSESLGSYTKRRRFFMIGVLKELNIDINSFNDFVSSYITTPKTLNDIKHLLTYKDVTENNFKYHQRMIERNKKRYFSNWIIDYNQCAPVIATKKDCFYDVELKKVLDVYSLGLIQGFPKDYFNKSKFSELSIQYAIGMSVPPIYTKIIGEYIKKVLS